jgi:hypothetical protein
LVNRQDPVGESIVRGIVLLSNFSMF